MIVTTLANIIFISIEQKIFDNVSVLLKYEFNLEIMKNKRLPHPNLNSLYRAIDKFEASEDKKILPLIGITTVSGNKESSISDLYIDAVLKAGGAPVLIPVIHDIPALTALVENLDGILVPGGFDVNPLFFGEEPLPQLSSVDTYLDLCDFTVVRLAANLNIPIMGVCRGHQVVNIAFGGTTYQDIYAERNETKIRHVQDQPRYQPSHTIKLTEFDSVLKLIFGEQTIWVNSFHHQAVKTVGEGFVVTALSPDGIIEGTQHTSRPIFTVQWHPEGLIEDHDEQMLKIYQILIENAKEFAKKKAGIGV